MTQVDLGLTGLTRLIRSLALMTVIKNPGASQRPSRFLIPYKYALSLQISPRKELRSCNVVLGAVAGAGGAIPASSGAGSAGNECGVVHEFPRLDFDPWLGRWWRRRAPSAAPGGGGRGGARSDDVAAPWRR
jgi:hypothetical protein